MSFYSLTPEAQLYLNQRFGFYDIDPTEAYNTLLSDEVKQLNSADLVEYLRNKDISHIISQNNNPELADQIDNVFIEDSSINRSRGSDNVTDSEIDLAWEDQIEDATEYTSENGLLDGLINSDTLAETGTNIVDFFDDSLAVATTLTGIEAYNLYKKGELQFNDVPEYITIKSGSRTIKCLVIGTALASSSPVIVAAGVGHVIYKNRSLLSKLYQGTYNFVTDEKTVEVATNILDNTIETSEKIVKATYDFVTDEKTIETTKKVADKAFYVVKETTKISLALTLIAGELVFKGLKKL